MVNQINMQNAFINRPDNTFQFNINQQQKINYKLLKTGGNDPMVSCKMKYGNVAKHVGLFSRYPLCNIKNPPTGIAQPVASANVNIAYFNQYQSNGPLANQPQQAALTKFLCTKP